MQTTAAMNPVALPVFGGRWGVSDAENRENLDAYDRKVMNAMARQDRPENMGQLDTVRSGSVGAERNLDPDSAPDAEDLPGYWFKKNGWMVVVGVIIIGLGIWWYFGKRKKGKRR